MVAFMDGMPEPAAIWDLVRSLVERGSVALALTDFWDSLG
jgi:hypothetical protein